MDKKFMKFKKVTLSTLTLLLISSQLFGCAATTPQQTLDVLQNSNTEIELQIEVPEDVEQGTQAELTWIELAYLNTYQDTLRTPMESILGVKFNPENFVKTGMLYESNEGFLVQNNTLKGALQNKNFREAVKNDEIISSIADTAFDTFVDLDKDDTNTNFYMAINAYFNLLPASEENHSNPHNVLTRAQAMALIYRADTAVDVHYLDLNEEFASIVGGSEYSAYAQHMTDYSYLDLESKSLTDKSYNANMSRGEFIYMLMSKYYADELANIDITGIELEDVEDGGDIAAKNGFADKDYSKNYELKYILENPTETSTPLYRALALAHQKGLIDSETRHEEGITLEESIEILMNLYKAMPVESKKSDVNEYGVSNKVIPEGSQVEKQDDGKLLVTLENGITYYVFEDGTTGMTVAQRREAKKIDPLYMEHLDGDADGLTMDDYKERQANGTLTWEDMKNLDDSEMSDTEYQKRTEDGFINGTFKTREDGTSYVELDNGDIIEDGDLLPEGDVFCDSASW